MNLQGSSFFFFDLLMHMMEGTLTPICYWADEIACRHLIPASVSCGNWGKLAVKWGMQSSSLCCRLLLLFMMSCWLPRIAPAWRWAAWWSVFQSRASEVDGQRSIEQFLPRAASWCLPSFFSLPSSLHRKPMLWKLLPLQFPLEPFPQ